MREGVQALDAILALNGIAMVNVGEKFVKAYPKQRVTPPARPSARTARRAFPIWANMSLTSCI